MRQFKFFQKEQKSFFNRMSEQLQTATDRIQNTNGILVPNDDIWTPQTNEIDNQVLQMVDEYFNIGIGSHTYKQTETLWMEMTSIDESPLIGYNHRTITLIAHMRNQPHSRIEYTIIRNEIGVSRILEKRSYNERF